MKTVTVTINGLYTTVFLRADWIPAALQRNRLYTTVFCDRLDSSRIAKNRLVLFEQTGFQPHCKEQIIHHCLLRADWIPAALQRNGLNTFCKEVGNIHFLS